MIVTLGVTQGTGTGNRGGLTVANSGTGSGGTGSVGSIGAQGRSGESGGTGGDTGTEGAAGSGAQAGIGAGAANADGRHSARGFGRARGEGWGWGSDTGGRAGLADGVGRAKGNGGRDGTWLDGELDSMMGAAGGIDWARCRGGSGSVDGAESESKTWRASGASITAAGRAEDTGSRGNEARGTAAGGGNETCRGALT